MTDYLTVEGSIIFEELICVFMKSVDKMPNLGGELFSCV